MIKKIERIKTYSQVWPCITNSEKECEKKKIKGTKCVKGPSNSLRDIRAPNWYKCKWVPLVRTEGVSLKASAAFQWAEWQPTYARISPANSLIAPRNWGLLIVRWLTWNSNYVGPRGRLMFQRVILAPSLAALCLWISRQMAYCQQRWGFVFCRAEKK